MRLGEQARVFVNRKFERGKILQEWHDVLVHIARDEPFVLQHDKRIMMNSQIGLHYMENVLWDYAHIKNFRWKSKIVTGY